MSKVLVTGDAFIDRYWLGRVRGPSAEAPIDVIDIKEKKQFSGGAGNVAENLISLGVNVVRWYSTNPVKNRLIVNDRQIARWDENDWCEPIEWIGGSGLSAVVVSDYGKGAVTRKLIKNYLAPASKVGMVYVDTKRDPELYEELENVMFFPNEAEYHKLSASYRKARQVLRTEGAKGATLLLNGEGFLHVPSFANRIVSVCGAGDTVMAGYIAGVLGGLSGPLLRESAIEYAMAAAAVVCRKPYTATATPEEVEEILSGFNRQ